MEHPMTSTLIIIPIAYRDSLNAAIAANPAFPASRPEEFSINLYAASDKEQTTPTHLWLNHRFTPSQRAVIETMKAAYPDAVVVDYDMTETPGHPSTVLANLSLVTKTIVMP
jgi:hypothetical protein